ncbi:apoptosis-inducing taf9-like domain 1 family protein [Neofusicoccum parvum]|uniref:Apoptosis-inducing taf9-like domain 1 family protein n=1 Tax=Neofusicoccum parvum TaxID=310453 RepID=A0ACB5SQE5_9PEZI|nr:apoptosis-inducing taf9-like domain 1 family protein [Neofusicoccum parvum]GME65225.1 apoptosis-inducing taf9-like domain 1 family protein [Neofusicoccum parvum]
MADDEAALKEERLKSALWYSIGQFVDAQCQLRDHNATAQFIGALTELVWTQIASASRDLSTFARHANRAQVNTSDVLLLARRNDGLEALLRQFVEEHRAARGAAAETRNAAGATTAGRRGGGGGRGARAGGAAGGRGRGRGRGGRGGRGA